MEAVIRLSDDNVRIAVTSEEDIDNEYNISLKGAIGKCIKHVYRYGEFNMPKNLMASILFSAYKGCNCRKDHLDISQRLSLYEYLSNKDIQDPYINQFLKDTRENFQVNNNDINAEEEKP